MTHKGKLHKNEKGEWVIHHKKDFDLIATDGGNIPTHPNHSFWLKMWANEGDEFHYQIDDEGYAILKSNKTENKTYPQD